MSSPRWSITEESLGRLLAAFDPDRERAAAKYLDVHRRLVRVFAWRGAPEPEDLADETMNRVATKLAEGLVVASGDPVRYLMGVASNVYRETMRGVRRRSDAVGRWVHDPSAVAVAPSAHDVGADELAALEGCFDQCLGRLADGDRSLVLAYHRSDGRLRIRERKQLARELETSSVGLRLRVHRIRRKLESWIEDCLRGGARS